MNEQSDYEILLAHRKTWAEKKILRLIYFDWYKTILSNIKKNHGINLELGSGSGNLKEYFNNIICSDIVFCPWINICFDAHTPAFKNNSFDNIIMIDVLHHLANPVLFLNNAHKILNQNGRIIILEPYSSLFSGIIYSIFHKEPFDFNDPLFDKGNKVDSKRAFAANQATAQILFYLRANEFHRNFQARYKIVKKELLSCISYPFSGGFENKSFLPDFLIELLIKSEKYLSLLGKLIAFRTLIVLEKTEPSQI